MPRKKDSNKQKKNKHDTRIICQCCNKEISSSSLGHHFYYNSLCFDYYQQGNLDSLISKTSHRNQSELSTKISNISHLNRNNINFYQSNDIDFNLFAVTDPNEINDSKIPPHDSNKKQRTTNDSTSIVNQSTLINMTSADDLSQLSHKSNDTNQSILNETIINDGTGENLDHGTIDKVSINITKNISTDSFFDKVEQLMTSDETANKQSENTPKIIDEPPSHIDFRNIQKKFNNQLKNLPIDNVLVSCIKLLKIMSDGHIPNTYFPDIIQWYEETRLSMLDHHQFVSNIPPLPRTKKVILKQLENVLFKTISSHLTLKPTHSIINLPSSRTAKISKFDIITSIFTLLTDNELMSYDNLLIGDPSYTNPDISTVSDNNDNIKDIHNGSAFKMAHEKLCNHEMDILVPIIPFIDGTPIDPYGRNKLEVVMFTLGIFNQSTRNKTKAWRLLGYLPDPCNESSGQDDYNESSNRNNAISKRMDYHHMLKYILSELIQLENSNGFKWDIYDSDMKTKNTYRLKFTVLFIIGDAVGNDKLCDRYISYSKNIKRLCRDCDCPTDELNNYNHICNFTKRADIVSMNDHELQQISYYKIENNALDKLSFGHNPFGTNGCLPPETLHQLNQGVFKKVLDYFDDCITNNAYKLINTMVKYLSINYHRQSSKKYPEIHIFKDGLDKCQLTGSEIITKVFMLYLSLIQSYTLSELPKIEKDVNPRSKKNKRFTSEDNSKTEFQEKLVYPKIGENIDTIQNWIKLLESTLCLDAWVRKDQYDVNEVNNYDRMGNHIESSGQISMRSYMKLFTKIVKDPVGNGTLTSKIHWLLHITYNIHKFGPPKVYSGQTPEHCLSPLVKWAARRTQLRPSTIIEQSSERYYEDMLVNRATDILEHQNIIQKKPTTPALISQLKEEAKKSSNKVAFKGIGSYKILFDRSSKKIQKIEWKNSKSNEKQISLNSKMINDIICKLLGEDMCLKGDEIHCFTSLYISKGTKESTTMYRADPYFYKKPWMDWCNSIWEYNGEKSEFPCRILMFIDTQSMSFDNPSVQKLGRYLAVVRSTNKINSSNTNRRKNRMLNDMCKLVEPFQIEKAFRLISCHTITKPIFVIPDTIKVEEKYNVKAFHANNILRIKDYKKWADIFLTNEWL